MILKLTSGCERRKCFVEVWTTTSGAFLGEYSFYKALTKPLCAPESDVVNGISSKRDMLRNVLSDESSLITRLNLVF